GVAAAACAPGHTEGEPACQQLKNDRAVMTWFDATDTPLVARFGYPCGWTTSVSELDGRTQANVTRSEIGPENAYVDVQVRNYHEPVSEGHLDSIAEEGSYDEVEYQYDGEVRTGLLSSADTAQYGTVAHATLPDPDSEMLAHVELVSTLKGADCPQPQPDYLLVKQMLKSLQPNRPAPAVRVSDQEVSGVVSTQGVTVDHVSLPAGGFVAIYKPPGPDEDPASTLLGASSYLTAGSHENVRVALDSAITSTGELMAVAHRDDDGNNVFEFAASPDRDRPYQGADLATVSDRATISVVTPTPVPSDATKKRTTALGTTQPSATLGDAATAGPTTTNPPSGGTTTADADGFGFGVSLAALAAATAVWIRRHRDGPGE
ncbi:MAG: hypothetical protein U5J98_00215, partial [Halobacteriales archaeon]|nr:hypothetical protein [Halobacteriales archaeon]